MPFEAVVRRDLPRHSDHAAPTENDFPLPRNSSPLGRGSTLEKPRCSQPP